ncbi:MAG: LamG domain-containing protein [Sedimentisphaerales bacterium]|nr:LamG domain-containing protein [Sedimentisphaerales bacterium]
MSMTRQQFTACVISIITALLWTSYSNGQVDPKSVVGLWRFDEASGNIAKDSSGHDYDADLKKNPIWVEGKFGHALEFQNGSYLEVRNSSQNLSFGGAKPFSITAWVRNQGGGTLMGKFNGGIIGAYIVSISGSGTVSFHREVDPWSFSGAKTLPDNDFGHVAVTYDGAIMKIYVNGEFDAEQERGPQNTDTATPVLIGARFTNNEPSEFFNGVLDDVALFDVALTEQQIRDVMSDLTFPKAYNPIPEDGAIHEDTWVSLSWSPGDFAASHDVYLGDNFGDVSNATHDSPFYWGNQASAFYMAGFPGFAYPEGLIPGATYYWRIDEVNDAHSNSPWKGDVWSFSIPPKTAFHPDPADGDAVSNTDNVKLRWMAGYGAKLHTVYIGNDYDEVSNAVGGMMQDSTTYNAGTLEIENVYYWRVDEFDAVETYKGDVWTFTTPGAVGSPQPANGATDVPMVTVLSWRAADNATSHQVYFGLDKDTVRSADTGSPEYKGSKALGDENYDPGLLELGITYYWRVDEVYNGNPAKGPVWSFTVGDYLVVDDFESYTDDETSGEAIWQTWIDGFGVADNGAQVGYLMPPYCERIIVHGGVQSMPLFYTNETGVTNSKGVMTLTTLRDWTQAGVTELSLWFRGVSGNAAEPLYVALSNSVGSLAVVAHDDPSAATIRSWVQWRIPLQSFADQGINLTNVDKLVVGLGSESGMATAGGSGTIYIDNIRLYRPTP